MKTTPCRHCGGRGRITFQSEVSLSLMSSDCTSCNGTGIAGDPRLLLGCMLLSAIVTVVGLYALFS